jgi:predicted acylesterase/phospholipase RssA
MTDSAGDPATPLPTDFASMPLLAGIDPAELDAPGSDASRVRLAGGETLFRQGDPADAVFVVLHGSLQVIVEDAVSGSRIVDLLGRGALIGEMALLLGDTRSATIVARRDSELLRIGRRGFEALLARRPEAGFELARILGDRLKRTTHRQNRPPRNRTIALLAATPGIDLRACAGCLSSALNELAGPVAVVTAAAAAEHDREGAGAHPDSAAGRRLQSWLDAWEDRFEHVIYVAEDAGPHWIPRCLRQADVVVLVADAALPPGDPGPGVTQMAPGLHRELLLLHPAGTVVAGAASLWLTKGSFARHHHVRADRDGDYARLARSLTRQSVGVVLSGGGARGFAHVGILKALEAHGIAVDAIGGASMGAIVAALYASGGGLDAVVSNLRRAFVARQPFGLTLPMVALTSGAGTVRRLEEMFGASQIEDLPIPYFCVSSNLSRAEPVVHDSGPLWLRARTSCAIPGLAPPVTDEGDLLVDGGLLNNLPADVMRQRCDGFVIGVNVTPDVDVRTEVDWPSHISGWGQLWRRFTARPAHPSIVEILSRTALVGSMRDAARMQAQCDLYIQPGVEHVGMSDFGAIDLLIDAGARAAEACLPAWIARGGEPEKPGARLFPS